VAPAAAVAAVRTVICSASGCISGRPDSDACLRGRFALSYDYCPAMSEFKREHLSQRADMFTIASQRVRFRWFSGSGSGDGEVQPAAAAAAEQQRAVRPAAAAAAAAEPRATPPTATAQRKRRRRSTAHYRRRR